MSLLLYAIHEIVHTLFASSQVHLSVLLPESLVAVLGFHFQLGIALTLEQTAGERIKGMVSDTRITDDDSLTEEIEEGEFHHHIIGSKHPFAIVQTSILLINFQPIHKVHIRLFWQCQFTSLHLIGRIIEDIYITTEAKVLLIVGKKMYLYTSVCTHIQRIHDIESVEVNSIFAERRCKVML